MSKYLCLNRRNTKEFAGPKEKTPFLYQHSIRKKNGSKFDGWPASEAFVAS